MRYDDSLEGLLEARRALLAAQQENSARAAKSHVYWTTTGSGEFVVEAALSFDCTFVAKPHFTYGVEVVGRNALVAGKFPRTHGGVYDWVRTMPPGNVVGDPDDPPGEDVMYYKGVYVYFTVDVIGGGRTFTPPQPKYTLIHHLAFEGLAIKDAPITHLLK